MPAQIPWHHNIHLVIVKSLYKKDKDNNEENVCDNNFFSNILLKKQNFYKKIEVLEKSTRWSHFIFHSVKIQDNSYDNFLKST